MHVQLVKLLWFQIVYHVHLEHSIVQIIKHVFLVQWEHINQKQDNNNVQNVQVLQVKSALLLDMVLDLLLIVKNGAQLVNSWIQNQDYVVHVVMDFSNLKKVHLVVSSVDLDKQLDLQKQHQDQNVEMNVYQECNLVLMEDVNHVQEELIDHKVYKPHANHVHLEEPPLKWVLHQLKNVHYQFAHQEHILMEQ